MPELEELEEQSAKPFDPGRYLDVVRRRHILFLTLLLLGWAAVWGSSWLLPVSYKSSTLILVEQPTMPKNYVIPNVNDDLQDRLQSITQQILSRTRLLLIIDKLNLYQNARRALTSDQKVERMRNDIEVELVRDQQNAAITAFRIFYSASNPHTAQRVTSELTNLFINENLRVREEQSEDTTQFLQSQLAIARSSLADQDAKVKAFQASHEGSLPADEASNLQILAGLQAQLQNEQDALNTARQERVYHQSLIDQYKSVHGVSQSADGAPTDLSVIDHQLDTLRTKLADLSTRYTDRYPEVAEVKADIAKTEKSREELIARMKKESNVKEPGATNQATNTGELAENGPLFQLESQLKSEEIEIANREAAITNLKSRINQYQGRLSQEPALAQQQADLTRGYEQSEANYNDLLKKESDSQMATSMEQMQEGERFTMIDPPSLPLKPDFPNRLKMCGIGAGVGVSLGLVVIGLLEFLDDRLRTDAGIEHVLSTVVISEVPEIVSAAEQKRNRRKLLLGWSVAVTVVVVILAATAFSYRGS